MKIGDKVRVTRNASSWMMQAIWWPENDVTGNVTKVCKNGSVYIAVDQFINTSEDGKMTKVFSKKDGVTITQI